MEEREISKLYYLASAIVSNPSNFENLIDLVWTKAAIKPSNNLSMALQSLLCICKNHKQRLIDDTTNETLAEVAEELFKFNNEDVRQAGRALFWALENSIKSLNQNTKK